jgi:hypothetical protein
VHVVLEFNPLQARDCENIDNALHWPVFFAVGDATLRYLAGDLATSEWMHAPGPLTLDESISWRTEVSASSITNGGYVGFGLLYSAGGADMDATKAAYQQLIATVFSLALEDVAHSSGLGALLNAFGSMASTDTHQHGNGFERLRKGIDPAELHNELDSDLLSGLTAFYSVGQSMLPFTPNAVSANVVNSIPISRVAAIGNAAVASIIGLAHAADEPKAATAFEPVAAESINGTTKGGNEDVQRVKHVPSPLAHSLSIANLTAIFCRLFRYLCRLLHSLLTAHPPVGTVIAVTLQAWRLDEIPSHHSLEINRPLQTRDSVCVSLHLAGRVGRED